MVMKARAAISFGPNRPLEIHTIDVAEPGPHQVAVRLAATGLCHSDLHMLEGKVPHSYPVVPGHEGFGTVIQCGDAVTQFKVGDTVIPYLVPDCGVCDFCKSGRTNQCLKLPERRKNPTTSFSLDGVPVAQFVGMGTFSEIVVVPDDMLVKVSSKADPAHACCIACGVTTGIGAVFNTAKVPAGATVAVFGVGGVGLSVVQGARLAGASRIIAVDRNAAKESTARTMGATDFIDASKDPDPVASIIKLTQYGVDFAFECVGIPALMRQALESTHPAWGVGVNVGVVEFGKELQASPLTLLSGRRWTGSMMGGAKRNDVARYVDWYVEGRINLDDMVSHQLKLEDINRGFDMMKSGESVRSIVVF